MASREDVKNFILEYCGNSDDSYGVDSELYAYSNYDFDNLVDAVDNYCYENAIDDVEDMDSDKFIDFLEEYSLDPRFTDNSGKTIDLSQWEDIDNQMQDDDEELYHQVMNDDWPCPAKKVFEDYSNGYKARHGEDWTPEFN